MVAEMVLAELAGRVAQIVEERGERRGPGSQVGRAARELRGNHARAQRIHAREEGVAPGGATLLSVIGHEFRAFFRDPVDVWRIPDHQALMIATRLHYADIIAHDEQDIWFLILRRGGRDRATKRSRGYKQRQAVMDYVSFHFCLLLLFRFWMCGGMVELS